MLRKINYEEWCALKQGDKVLLRHVFAKELSGHPIFHGEVLGRSDYFGGHVYVWSDAPGWDEHCGLQMGAEWSECRSFHCKNYYTIVVVD